MKNGYDPFLDFLKGFCILSVICHHCLMSNIDSVYFVYWGQLAVPLFLILQSYHVFRRDNVQIGKPQITKMMHRIFLPFAAVTLLEFSLCLLFRDTSLTQLAKGTILSGGIGPGSYYFWVYLQFFFLVPLTYWAFRRFNINLITGGGIFTIICIITELACSYIDMRNDLYRLSCLRYIYLIYLGYVWSRKGIRLTFLTVSLSIVSIVFLTIFTYTDYSLEPVFHNFSWKACHWICYFYPAFLLMFILKWAYNNFGTKIRAVVEEIGRYSWQIFLMQMFFFAMFPKGRLLDMGDHYITMTLFCFLAFAFSIIPVIAYNRIPIRNKA